MRSVASGPSTAIAPARRCAFAVVRRVFERGAYADLALHAEAERLDRRDRALATRLAYGTVQRKGTLDHLIERLAGRRVGRLDAPVLAALRLGLYELLYLSGAPDRAVVADAVELAKVGGGRGHGLVNAVLRRAAREGGAKLLGALADDTPEQAAVMHSHPEWIARLWWELLGAQDARALMAYDNVPSEVALRVNTLVTDAPRLANELLDESVRAHVSAALDEAIVLDGPFDAHASPLWHAGAFVAQRPAARRPTSPR
jgi:16S rRNA (cytosine967-C5)-methyltransferase